jgi:preprotein translocase subunit SecY
MLLVIVVVIGAVVFVEQSQRRVPVQYAKRMVGRRMYGGSSTYIPIKINMAGVIPIIFASSLLAVPGLIAQFGNQDTGWVIWVRRHLADSAAPLHIALYVLLIVFFCFFYTSITFNPDEVADNMKKYGGFIPGIRAGRPTAEYLDYVISRITSAGSIYLAIVALIPTLTLIALGVTTQLPFGGSSILIVVGVGLETVKQIDSQLQQRHYEGFLR